MKSSKLSDRKRRERRDAIMTKREATRRRHASSGRSYVRGSTTRFDKHSSDRQRARYAKQTGYVAPQSVTKPKARRTRKIAG